MRVARTLLCAGTLAATLHTAAPALACGALPTPNFTFAESTPRDGATGVVRDAPIEVRFDCELDGEWSASVREASCQASSNGALLELRRQGSASPVPGRAYGQGTAQLFAPAEPLEPDTDYELLLRHSDASGQAAPEDPQRVTFRTSAVLLPALHSERPLATVLEWYDAPATRCDGRLLVGDEAAAALLPQICPIHGACTAAGPQRAVRVRASLGPLSGGDSSHAYTVELSLSDYVAVSSVQPPALAPEAGNESHDVRRSKLAVVAAGEPVELALDLQAPRESDTPLCIRLRAADAAGHQLALADHCTPYAQLLRELGPDPAVAAIDAGMPTDIARLGDAAASTADPAPGDAGAPALAMNEVSSASGADADGCHAGTTRPDGGAAVAFALAVLALQRRRRTR